MPELSALLQALSNPKAYPHDPLRVELVQTRISAVFLAGDYVYNMAVCQKSNRSNAQTEQAYINNEKAFEKDDLDDLKRSNPNLDIVHLIVDTQYDAPEYWYIVGIEEI